MLSHIKDGKNSWTVIVNNKSYQFDQTHPEYTALVECVRTGDGEGLIGKLEVGQAVQTWSEGDFKFVDGVLMYMDEEVHNVIAARILEMIEQEFDCKPMLRFLERLYKNPSFRAINELYTFMVHGHLPITPEGYLLAYKAVTSDFKDKHTGEVDNSVGAKVSMARHKVDDNCNVGCSHGYHVGAIEYVKSYGRPENGDKVVICQVDPADVVSVPLDSSHQKVRVCAYEVVAEYEGDLLGAVHDYSKGRENEERGVDTDGEDGYNEEEEYDDGDPSYYDDDEDEDDDDDY